MHLEWAKIECELLKQGPGMLSRVGLRRTIQSGTFFLCLAFSSIQGHAKTTPTLTVATSGTPSSYGSSVTFTATISSGPTGTITFLTAVPRSVPAQ